MYEEITKQLSDCLTYLKNAASLRPGAVVVMGCSTSEVAGGHIGHNSVPELGDALAMTMIDTCRELGLPLFVDGARLGYGLAAMPDVDLPFLASICDAFYIGGTKVGLLFGEAIVLTSDRINKFFRYHIKQRGAMLAKGRLLGVQFEAILKDDDYVTLAARANGMAQEIKQAFLNKGCQLYSDTIANQIFVILPDEVCDRLGEKYAFSVWEKLDEGRTAVRFCTNVTTAREDVDALLSDIEKAF